MHFHILNEPPQISYSQKCSGDNSTLFFLKAVPNTEHRFSLQVEIKLQSYVGCKIPVHSSKQSINMVKLDSDEGFSSKRLDDGKATESNE